VPQKDRGSMTTSQAVVAAAAAAAVMSGRFGFVAVLGGLGGTAIAAAVLAGGLVMLLAKARALAFLCPRGRVVQARAAWRACAAVWHHHMIGVAQTDKHGGELVAAVLKAHGVKFLFTLVGG
jgi:hypothetical protein